jgi:hypothetical protein
MHISTFCVRGNEMSREVNFDDSVHEKFGLASSRSCNLVDLLDVKQFARIEPMARTETATFRKILGLSGTQKIIASDTKEPESEVVFAFIVIRRGRKHLRSQ